MKHKIKDLLYSLNDKIIKIFIAKPLQILSLEKIIIFESIGDFSDNSKALFDEMIKHEINNSYKIYWLVENLESFKSIDIKNVEFISIKRKTIIEKISSEFKLLPIFAKSKYYFFTHRNFSRIKPKKEQVFFNLTHGMSLKNTKGKQGINLDNSSYILVTSNYSGYLRTQSYEGGGEQLQILGFPRNDLLFSNLNHLEKIGVDKYEYEKVIMWLPTFRRHKNKQRNDTGIDDDLDIPLINSKQDLINLDIYLQSKKMIMLIKPHPSQDLTFFKKSSMNNIKVISDNVLTEKEVHLYELLSETDALITDYSSVYIDYLNINKPIGFTVNDFKNYKNTLGFLVTNPLDYMPGPKIINIEDLITFLENIKNNEDFYYDARLKINKVFNKYSDANSSERILKFLKLIN